MRSRFEYFRPRSLDEALGFLAAHGPRTSVMAGGTDLMILIRRGDVAGKFVMDISRLDELRGVGKIDNVISLGAAVTYTEIVNDKIVKEFAPALVEAAGQVGSVQIRNVGTPGGNAANASPAADSVPPILVHNGRVIIRSAFSERIEPLQDLIVGPYRTNLKPEELITGFLLEAIDGTYRYSFERIARRKALAVARINAAALARLDSAGVVEDLRLSVGSITPQPARMTAAENHLIGRRPNMAAIREAAEKVTREMIRRSGIRSSTEYKKPAVEGLVTKALTRILI
ncbi:MAG: FAD binding domain-containing protein [Desulfomonile tiedjei]|nr:FAD binding domain-containing protein [Desulfomonile tiedjei]